MIKTFRHLSTDIIKEQRDHLIRVLSKTSLLPKLDYCNIRRLFTPAYGFRILPGKGLELGQKILANVPLTIVYIRYGFEWQIWYRASKGQINHALCDIAAARVTALFLSMLSSEDQDTVAMALPTDFERILSKFSDAFPSIPQLTAEELAYLAALRKKELEEPEVPSLSTEWNELLVNLANATECLFITGGDVRLQINTGDLLNVYGCRPFPRPEAYTFSSSTATSVSNYSYSRVELLRQKMVERCLKSGVEFSLGNLDKETVISIRKILGLSADNEVILSPSGTDAALHTVSLAMLNYDKPIASVVVCSDQTGSGVLLAVEGKHFATCTALGAKVVKGERIEGFPDSVEAFTVSMRDEAGRLRDKRLLDENVQSIVADAISRGFQVLLYVMEQSKLGCSAPSPEVVDQLAKCYANDLLIAVDACQLRLDPEDLKKYLDKGYLVIITGSKFYTGPPFSGAVIVPSSLSKKLRETNRRLPVGLSNYSNAIEWPTSWKCIETLGRGYNLGVYMRWRAALYEMQRYRRVPKMLRLLALDLFCSKVLELLSNSPYVEQLSVFTDLNYAAAGTAAELTSRRTIFPFFIYSGKERARILSAEQVDKMYVLLNRDISAIIPNSSGDVQRLASRCCHIGQPVRITHPSGKKTAVLRISVGARVISGCWQSRDISLFFEKVKEEVSQVDIIIRKIGLILEYPFLLQ